MLWLSNQRIQSIVFYVGGAWALLQAIEFFSQKYDWSPKLFHYSLILLSGGLIVLVVRLLYSGRRKGRLFVMSEALIISLLIISTVLVILLFPPRQKLMVKETSGKVKSKPTKQDATESYLRAKYFLNLSDGITQIDSAIYYLNKSIQSEGDVA